MNEAAGLALGTAQWGLAYGIANRSGQPPVETVRKMLRVARDNGVKFLDTARAYGESEQVIGDLIGSNQWWSIVTKLSPDATTPQVASQSLEASRRELQRDRLDAVLLHRWEHRRICDGAVWDLLRRERDAGRVENIGASAKDPDEACEMLADRDVQVIQVASSLFDQRLTRSGFFEKAAALGKLVFVRSVFLQGVAHLSPENLPQHLTSLAPVLRTIQRWATDRDSPAAAVFLAFALTLPKTWILVGCETLTQLTENLRCWSLARALATQIGPLAETIPTFTAQVLNPALWPS